MRGAAAGIAICLLLATAVRAAPPADAPSYRGDLAALFVAPGALGRGWEVVHERSLDPSGDPELRRAGVRRVRSQHYTRGRSGTAEVCSLEIWAFASPGQAALARRYMDRAGWRFLVRGNLVVMLRGVTHRRGGGFRRGLLPACHRLAELTEARAEALLR